MYKDTEVQYSEEPFEIFHDGESILGVINIPKTTRSNFPCVLICYGFDGNRTEVNRISVSAARKFSSYGIACARFDYLGCGVSGGYFHERNLQDRSSQAAIVIDHLISKFNVDASRLGLIGFSDGCRVLLDTVSKTKYPIKAASLWSPMISTNGVTEATKNTSAGSLRRLPAFKLNKIEGKRLFSHWSGLWVNPNYFYQAEINYIEKALEFFAETETLSVIGGNDLLVADTKLQFKKFKNNMKNLQLHIIKDANHVFSSKQWIAELLSITLSYFAGKLLFTSCKKGENMK